MHGPGNQAYAQRQFHHLSRGSLKFVYFLVVFFVWRYSEILREIHTKFRLTTLLWVYKCNMPRVAIRVHGAGWGETGIVFATKPIGGMAAMPELMMLEELQKSDWSSGH